MRHRRLNGEMLEALGLRYGVTRECVRRICKGDYWKTTKSGYSPS